VQFGVLMFPTDYSIGVVDLARATEERGFESLWFPEHTHIPADRLTPWPGGPDLPREYSHPLDPFVAMGAALAATRRLKLGTGVCLVVERDPITLAKDVASVDYMSGGRFLFGIGGGWNLEEMRNHGTDPAKRWAIMRERILAMKQLWTEDVASFQGTYVSFERVWQWPKPVQRPHPPIIVGGNGPHTLRRVLDYGDEWGPIIGRGPSIAPRMAELAQLGRDAGRPSIPVTIFSLGISSEQLIDEYTAAGASRFLFGLPAAPAEKILPLLDRYARMATLT
jgi:probable F420-dependent oxidoreductase